LEKNSTQAKTKFYVLPLGLIDDDVVTPLHAIIPSYYSLCCFSKMSITTSTFTTKFYTHIHTHTHSTRIQILIIFAVYFQSICSCWCWRELVWASLFAKSRS